MNSTLSTLFQSSTPEANAFFIVGIIAFVIWMAYIVRLWFVQTATFNIEKDVADIRDHLFGLDAPVKDAKPSSIAELKDYIPEDEKRALVSQSIAKLKPRRAFMWIALSIPALLIILVVLSSMIH